MASIRFISSSMIQAGNPCKETNRIELTPWDLKHLLLGIIQKGLLFRNPKPKQDDEQEKASLIHRLKTSLSRTLDFFFPLAGRLAVVEHDDGTTSFFIDCNNAGALFVHAIAEDVNISDLLEPVYVPEIVDTLFQLGGVKNIEGTSKPLLAVQVTELVDGIFIGCSVNHAVVDGSSFWHLFNSWSEISIGFDSISKIPIFQRPVIDDIEYPIRIPLKKEQSQEHFFPSPNLKARVFKFRKESIAKIKRKANDETNTNTNTNTKEISSLQALLSLFWQCIMRNRQLDPNQDTVLFFGIGVRKRMHRLTEEYFGNALQTAIVKLKAGELRNAAFEINQVVANNTEEKFISSFKTWVNSPLLYQIGKTMKNTLFIANSHRFDIYGNGFGWGRPIAMINGEDSKIEGLLTVSPGVEEGDIQIEACLSSEMFQVMENDEQFVAALNI